VASRLPLTAIDASVVSQQSADPQFLPLPLAVSMLCGGIEERQFDVLVVVETWHECCQSVALKRIVPPGYQSIDATRLIPPDVCTETFQNHGGLAFICRQATVRVQKRLLNVTVTTFEYLCGYVSTNQSLPAARHLPTG